MKILVQLMIVLVSLFAVYAIYKKSGKFLSKNTRILWGVLWLAIAIFGVVPELSSKLAGLLGIGRGVDLIFYATTALILLLLLKFHIKLEQQSRHITRLTRKIALEK